jgi:hypothetical protein
MTDKKLTPEQEARCRELESEFGRAPMAEWVLRKAMREGIAFGRAEQQSKGEPVAWQWRRFSKATNAWTEWELCAPSAIADFAAEPAHEVRALYAEAPQAGWTQAAEWLRNNYQNHANIASLVDAMCAAAPQPPAPASDARLDDLSALVSRLAQALSKAAPTHDLPAKAMDYLRRKDLLGSPLRTASEPTPIDMILYCPKCGMQHVDKPEGQFYPGMTADESTMANKHYGRWDNPPHRSHLCHGCGFIWRPADVPTNGVAAIKTDAHGLVRDQSEGA